MGISQIYISDLPVPSSVAYTTLYAAPSEGILTTCSRTFAINISAGEQVDLRVFRQAGTTTASVG